MRRSQTHLTLLAALFATPILSFAAPSRPGDPADKDKRSGDEIVIGGEWFHTGGVSVVLWTDPDGRDLSNFARRPVTRPGESPNSPTTIPITPTAAPITSPPITSPVTLPSTNPALAADDMPAPPPIRVIRGPNVPLADLQKSIDQFVIHFDACGTSQECFRVLKKRGLSVQFMLDIDGTVYQAMDVGAAAAHATIANSRSVGVEIANIGGYDVPGPIPPSYTLWYRRENGQTRIIIPADRGDGGVRTKNFIGKPDRPEPFEGMVQGKRQRQYDFTPQQYRALAKLTATLCTVLPEIKPDFPRQTIKLGPPHPDPATQPTAGDPTTQPAALAELGQQGALIPHMLTPMQYAGYHGVLGHYHVQFNKDDPGPAFQWVPLMNEVRKLMGK